MDMNKEILEKEVYFKTSRSSGAGGQHVNKVETRVTLLWDLENSIAFNEEQKECLKKRLASRLNQDFIIQLDVSETRSQLQNKIKALEKFYYLLKQALAPEKKRIKTKIPYNKVLKRLENKKHLASKKTNRRWRFE